MSDSFANGALQAEDEQDPDMPEQTPDLTPEQQSLHAPPAVRRQREPNFPHTARSDEELLTMRSECEASGSPVSFRLIGKHLGCSERTAARRYSQLDDAIGEMVRLGVKNRSPTHWIQNAKYEGRGRHQYRPEDDDDDDFEDLPDLRYDDEEVVDCDDDDVCLSRQASEHDMRPSPTSETHNPINGEKQAARTARLYMETLGSRNTLKTVQAQQTQEATRVLSRSQSGQTSRGRRGSSHGHGAKEVPPPASPQVPAPCSCPSCLLNPTG
jgi:hypothetical protein